MENREQKLVDICFQIGITINNNERFQKMSVPEVADWIAKQLRGCGFDTYPCGASWGVLKNDWSTK